MISLTVALLACLIWTATSTLTPSRQKSDTIEIEHALIWNYYVHLCIQLYTSPQMQLTNHFTLNFKIAYLKKNSEFLCTSALHYILTYFVLLSMISS